MHGWQRVDRNRYGEGAHGGSNPSRSRAWSFLLASYSCCSGIVGPARLSALNRLWLRMGATIAKATSPIILVLLFFAVVTPIALVMRILGKRPLSLTPNRTAATYWIERRPRGGKASSMRQQFWGDFHGQLSNRILVLPASSEEILARPDGDNHGVVRRAAGTTQGSVSAVHRTRSFDESAGCAF